MTTSWGEWDGEGHMGRDEMTGHDSRWVSTRHDTTETSIKKSNIGHGETIYV